MMDLVGLREQFLQKLSDELDAQLTGVRKLVTPADTLALKRTCSTLATATASEQLGMAYDQDVLKDALATMKQYTSGAKTFLGKSLAAGAKRWCAWLISVGFDAAAGVAGGWVNQLTALLKGATS